MADGNPKPLPVSSLPEIKANQISNDDLLLVTDIDGGSKTSRKMTMAQLVQYVYSQIAKNPGRLDAHMRSIAEDVFNDNIEDGVVDTVQDNHSTVLDLLDGVPDNELLLNGGDAGEQEEENG